MWARPKERVKANPGGDWASKMATAGKSLADAARPVMSLGVLWAKGLGNDRRAHRARAGALRRLRA